MAQSLAKFVLINDRLHIGPPIKAKDKPYSHTQLAYTATENLDREARAEVLASRIDGWIITSGKKRSAIVVAGEPDAALARVRAALKKQGIDANVEREESTNVSLPPSEGHVGDTIRRVLGLHGLNASQAAELLGLTPQALSQIQRGHRRPSLDTLRRFSTFFELPMERLLQAPFSDLLINELSNLGRFHSVEAAIGAARQHSKRGGTS